MRRLICLLTFCLGCWFTSWADTIDYWHVYYNGKKIAELGAPGIYELKIKARDIKTGDSLVVYAYRCAPCHDCNTRLLVADNRRITVTEALAKGTRTPLAFSLDRLREFYGNSGQAAFDVFYAGEYPVKRPFSHQLFRIRLE